MTQKNDKITNEVEEKEGMTQNMIFFNFWSLQSFLSHFSNKLALMLPGEVNISQLHSKIEFNTFLFDKPYN